MLTRNILIWWSHFYSAFSSCVVDFSLRHYSAHNGGVNWGLPPSEFTVSLEHSCVFEVLFIILQGIPCFWWKSPFGVNEIRSYGGVAMPWMLPRLTHRLVHNKNTEKLRCGLAFVQFLTVCHDWVRKSVRSWMNPLNPQTKLDYRFTDLFRLNATKLKFEREMKS